MLWLITTSGSLWQPLPVFWLGVFRPTSSPGESDRIEVKREQRERAPKEDRNVSHPLCFEYGMRRPVSCCFGFQMGQHIRVLSAHSVLIPIARDLLSMDQIDNLGSLVYVRLCCRTMTYSQQVQSVYAHLFTGGSLACAWASPVKKSLWRISGGSNLPQKPGLTGTCSIVFTSLTSPWSLSCPKQIKGDLRFGYSVKVVVSSC